MVYGRTVYIRIFQTGGRNHRGLQDFEPSGRRGKQQREGGRDSGGDMRGTQSHSACWALQQEPLAYPLAVAGSLELAGRGGREAADGPILGCRKTSLGCWQKNPRAGSAEMSPPSLTGSCSTGEGRGVCAATTDGAECPVRVLCLLHVAMTIPSQVPWGVGDGGVGLAVGPGSTGLKKIFPPPKKYLNWHHCFRGWGRGRS